jgi:hypothetical protein
MKRNKNLLLPKFLPYFPYFEKLKEAYQIILLSVSLCSHQRMKAGIVEPE